MRTFGALIDWLLRNFLRLIIIAVIVFAAVGFLFQTCEAPVGQVPGRVDDMAFMIKTDSRIFYVNDYQWDGGVLIISDFWVKEGKNWRHYDRDMKLNTQAYSRGGIKIEKR